MPSPFRLSQIPPFLCTLTLFGDELAAQYRLHASIGRIFVHPPPHRKDNGCVSFSLIVTLLLSPKIYFDLADFAILHVTTPYTVLPSHISRRGSKLLFKRYTPDYPKISYPNISCQVPNLSHNSTPSPVFPAI
jgi:hypothetical protein